MNSIVSEGEIRGLSELAGSGAGQESKIAAGESREALYLPGSLVVRWINDARTGLTWFICRDTKDDNDTNGSFVVNRRLLQTAEPLCEVGLRSRRIEQYAIQFALEGPRISYVEAPKSTRLWRWPHESDVVL